MDQIRKRNDHISWYEVILSFGTMGFVIAVFYFFGSCVFMPSYEMQAMSGNYGVFDQALVGEGPRDAVLNKNLFELAEVTKQGIEKSDLSQTQMRLDNLQDTCKQHCTTELSQSPVHYHPGSSYYYPPQNTVCTYSSSCTEADYKTYEHLRDMLDAGVLTQEKMHHYLANYPSHGSWFIRFLWVWLGGFIASAVIIFALAVFSIMKESLQKKKVAKAQKIHDKVRVLETYKTPGFSEKVSSKSLRMQLEMNLIEEEDQREAVRAMRFLERNGR
jgi:hypothetical protein